MATYDLDGETSNRKYSEYAESSLPQNSSRTPLNVRVDDDHPFDIDAYMTGYSSMCSSIGLQLTDPLIFWDTDRNAAVRLLFIARNAPRLHDRAIQLASELVLKTKDVKLYGDILSEANSPHSSHHLTPNHKWVEETTHRNTSEKDRLEVDLKTYTTNLIKESIRVGGIVQ
jgi:COP9 signalosome complex subunit 1